MNYTLKIAEFSCNSSTVLDQIHCLSLTIMYRLPRHIDTSVYIDYKVLMLKNQSINKFSTVSLFVCTQIFSCSTAKQQNGVTRKCLMAVTSPAVLSMDEDRPRKNYWNNLRAGKEQRMKLHLLLLKNLLYSPI